MHRRFLFLLTAGALALGSLTVACGDDDNGSSSQVDAGTDTGTTPPTPPPNPPPPPPGPDGGCTFAGYVINLVQTQTTSTSKPDTTLGAGCTDSTSQADFKPLFP